MPARNHAAAWVLGLRNQLRSSVGPAYRVLEQRGKAKLDVRFEDGSRATAVLPFPWLPAQATAIQRGVEIVAQTIAAGRTLREAVDLLQGGATPSAPSPVAAAEPELLLQVWERFGHHKVRRTGEVKASTWERDYGKTAKRLAQVADARDAKELLTRASDAWDPGSRTRQQVCQHLAAMLRWAVEVEVLPADRWLPPQSLKAFTGEKPVAAVEATPLKDVQILELLDSLPHDPPGERWRFCLQLIAAYGLRPVEVLHLQLKPSGELWCNYIKRSGGGSTRPRALRALHPEWQEEWCLLERLASTEALPPFGGSGVAEAARKYLSRQAGWKPLADQGFTVYGFRHGYALRAHQSYGLSPRVAARLMGHSVETHIRSYGTWADLDEIDAALEAGIRYRSLTQATTP